MIILNLATEKLKHEINIKLIYLIIKRTFLILIFLMIFISLVLYFYKNTIKLLGNEVSKQYDIFKKNTDKYNKKSIEVNTLINDAEKINSEKINWTLLFKNVTDLIPAGIKISALTINKEKIVFNGLAKERTDLLNLRKNLEQSKLFLEINFPFKNISEKDNINFNIEAKLNLIK